MFFQRKLYIQKNSKIVCIKWILRSKVKISCLETYLYKMDFKVKRRDFLIFYLQTTFFILLCHSLIYRIRPTCGHWTVKKNISSRNNRLSIHYHRFRRVKISQINIHFTVTVLFTVHHTVDMSLQRLAVYEICTFL